MTRLITLGLGLAAAVLVLAAYVPPAPGDKEPARVANRPKVPGKLRLNVRERKEGKVVERAVDWEAAETAIIVCDMWDDHHCKLAAQRVGVMAPRMNQVLTAARDRGVMIIHAPSETMNIYAGSPQRTRMEQARPAKPPVHIERRCDRDPQHEPKTLPVDVKLDCDDCELGPVVRRHSRQHAALDITGFDGISDSGQEIYNFCEQEGIKNIVLMGVHTNYCVVARPFGIRQMLKLGKNVVLARDLTDALYDPREPPYVSHARGTEIVIEHIERYLCPSILSVDLTRTVPGSDGPTEKGAKGEPGPSAPGTTGEPGTSAPRGTGEPGTSAPRGTGEPGASATGEKGVRRIFAAGGGILGGGPDYLLLRYLLSLPGKEEPVVCCLPTARGDNLENLAAWYEIMNRLPCRPKHLRLYGPTAGLRDFEKQLLAADIIFVPGGNTLNMLATWKAQGVDVILKKAYDRGIILAGESAGMVCWFEQAVTDSRPERLTTMDCLGWLPGSGIAHYHYAPQPRRPRFHELLLKGEMKDGLACDDGAAILFEEGKVAKVVAMAPGVNAYRVRRVGDRVVEETLPAELLQKDVIKPIVIDLWPGKPPGDVGIDAEEKVFQLQVKGKPYEVAGKPTHWVTNVSKPQVVVYPAPKDRNTGVAMLICPGGGYHNLGWDVEGEEVAAWLNSVGMTGIILKYRCPRRPGDVKGVPPIGPLKDAQRAVSLVRTRAKEWGIDPAKIGMVGFSAGGHLSAATALNHDKRAYDPIDDVDRASCRPDFAVPIYSGYLVGNDNDVLSADMRVAKDAPPILLIHAGNDSISKAENSAILYLALKKAGARAELHIYASGEHGFGVRKVGHPCAGWTDRCLDFLKDQGILR